MKTHKVVLSLLGLSLAINLACVGFFIGQRVNQAGHFGPDPMKIFPRWAHTLPEPRRIALRPMLRQQRQEARLQMQEIRRAHAAVHATLVTEDFDEVALVQGLERLRVRLVASQNASHADFVEFVRALSMDERKQLATQLHHQGKGPRPSQRPPGIQGPRPVGNLPPPRPKGRVKEIKPFIQPEN